MEFKIKDILNAVKNKTIVIDVDFDFFYNSEDCVLDNFWKYLPETSAPDDFFREFVDLEFKPIVSHDEALRLCCKNKISSSAWIHFDFHHDWYISPDSLNALSLGCLDGALNCANYAAIAAKAGFLDVFVWVYPDIIDRPTPIRVPSSLKHMGVKVFSISYREYRKYVHARLEKSKISLGIACLSPDFVPEKDFHYFFKKFKCDKEFRYRAYDYAFEEVVSNRRRVGCRYFRLNLSKDSRTMFHGSKTKNLTALDSTSGKVHLSPSAAFAACYGFNIDSSKGWIQGVDPITGNPEGIFLIPPNGDENLSNAEASLYLVDRTTCKNLGTTGCAHFDHVFKSSVKVLFEEDVESVSSHLRQLGVVIYQRKSSLDTNQFLIEDVNLNEFSDWMKMPLEALAVLQSTLFHLMIFTQLRSEDPWIPFMPLVYWERLASRCLYPQIPNSLSNTADDGFHGLSHGLDTALISVIFSYALKVPAAPTFLAALCHDLELNSCGNSSREPESSATVLRTLLNGSWNDYSGKYDKVMIEAVARHSEHGPAGDHTAMVLRDSDRVRLSWERGYDSNYFATEIGKEVAKSGANYLGELQARLMFAENVVLEIGANKDGYRLSIWNVGRRYDVNTPLSLTKVFIDQLVAMFNVTKIVLLPQLDLETEYIADICPDHIALVIVSKFQDAFKPKETFKESVPFQEFIWTFDVDVTLRADILSVLQWLPEGHTPHVEVGTENLEWVCENLWFLSSIEARLIYCRNPKEDVGEEFNRIVEAMVLHKKQHADLLSVRLISPYSWCWLETPEHAITLLCPASVSYSPLTIGLGPNLNQNVFDSTLEDVRLRRSTCGDCALAVNCISLDFAVLGSEVRQKPCCLHLFQTWTPYLADGV